MGERGNWTGVLLAAAIVALLAGGYVFYRLGQQLGSRVAPLSTPVAAASGSETPVPFAAEARTPTVARTTTPTPSPLPTSTPLPTTTPTPTPTPIITALPPIPQGFLVTVNQPVQVVKTYDSAPDWWPSFPPFNLVRGSFTIVAYSNVPAGIDFTQVGEGDVIRRGDAVTITLPGPQLYGRPAIDPAQSYIMEHPGISPRDLSKVLSAQSDLQGLVENWALQHGILSTARDTGQEMVELWFRRLGFTDITINWDYRQ